MEKEVKIPPFFQDFRFGLLFLAARLIMVISIPIEGLKSYGDFWNFYHLAGLGRPFLDFWVEFPPIFPVLSRFLFLLVGGKEHSFIYALIVLFSIIQASNVVVFHRISTIIHPQGEGLNRVLVYAFLLVGLFYGWAYFDSLAIFCLLLSLLLLLKGKDWAAGLAIGIGGVVKWFPVLLLPAAWKWLGKNKALRLIMIAALVIGLTWGSLYLISPELTQASFISQSVKGSWETVWALIDGNLGTGNFDPLVDRTLALSASVSSKNEAVVPAWLSLIIIGGIGYYIFWKSSVLSPIQLAAFSGLTLALFFLWSPGYSPQWVLYLLPIVMLCFEETRSVLLALVLLFVNLLEWPVILSRGWFHYLDEVVLLRTGLFVLLVVLFAQIVMEKENRIR